MALAAVVALITLWVAWMWTMRRWVEARDSQRGRRVYSTGEWATIAGIWVVALSLWWIADVLLLRTLPLGLALIGLFPMTTAVVVGAVRVMPQGTPAGDRKRSVLIAPGTWAEAVRSAACLGGVFVALGLLLRSSRLLLGGAVLAVLVLVRFGRTHRQGRS